MQRKIIWCVLLLAAAMLATPAAAPAAAPADEGPWPSISQGDFQIKLRNYFMDRDFNDGPDQAAWAIGGEFAYVTKPWHGLSVGGSFYTSQPFFYAPADRSGTDLLDDSQDGYSVLGQAYLKAEHHRFRATIGRQIIDTPFLNPFDFRMTPVTYEALSLGYAQGGLSLSLAQVVGIKTWNDTTFQPMSRAAGIQGSNEALTMGGAVYQWGNYMVQLWDYYSYEFMNSLYAQADASWKLNKDWIFAASVQAMRQQDVGQALYGKFNAFQAGAKAALSWRQTTLTMAFTGTDNDHDMVNPWAAWPGYTSIMELNNDLAGQATLLFRLGADMAQYGIQGMQATLTHTRSTVPEGQNLLSPDQLETDVDLKYYFRGELEPLWVRLRVAYVDQDITIGGDTYTDFRLIVNYDFTLQGFHAD